MKLFNVLTSSGGKAQVLLYGYVGEGEKVDAANVVAQLMELESQYSQIDIHINSNGGDVFNGIAIYNALKSSKADISIYIDGVAASIAGIIALCGKPLYMNQYSRLMLHAVSGGSYGNASDLRKTADMMEDIQHDLAKMIAKKCGMAEDAVYTRFFDEKDHWLTATEAKDLGIIDDIVAMDEEGQIESGSNAEEIYKYFNNRLDVKAQSDNKEMKLEAIKAIEAFKDVLNEEDALKMMGDLAQKASLVDSLQTKVNELEGKLADLHAKADEAIIDQAIEVGKITAEQKDTFVNLMKADKENTVKLLDSLSVPKKEEPKPEPKKFAKASDVFKNEGNSTFETMPWDELDKKGLLVELKNTNMELFKNKYKAKFGEDYNG